MRPAQSLLCMLWGLGPSKYYNLHILPGFIQIQSTGTIVPAKGVCFSVDLIALQSKA